MSRAAWGYTGLFLVVLAACVRLLFEGTALIALVLGALGTALFLVYFFQSGETMRDLAARRSTREGGNVFGTTLFVLGSLVLINLMGARVHWWHDLTADRLFTLAPETRSALATLDPAPEISVFYLDGSPAQSQIRSVLDAVEMDFPQVTVRYVDPEKSPREVARYNLRHFCTVVEAGGRREDFTGTGESDLVAALLRLRPGIKPRLTYLQGHGEPVETPGEAGYSMALEAMVQRGYEVDSVEFARGDSLGHDVDVLWVANPQVALSPEEQKKVETYLGNGGNLLLMLDPSSPVTYGEILSRYGVEFLPEFIVDPEQQNPEHILAQDVSTHPSTRELAVRNISVVFPGAGQVRRTQSLSAVYVSYLMWSSGKARLTEDPRGEAAQRALAMAFTTKTRPATRILIVGDADFAKNRDYAVLGNADFFLSAVRWLIQDTAPVSITPRDVTNRPVVVSRQQGRAFTVLFVGLLPLAVIVSGTLVWWRRR